MSGANSATRLVQTRLLGPWSLLVTGCWTLGIAISWEKPVLAEMLPTIHYAGSWSCSSASCHGKAEPRRGVGTVAGNEFATWMRSDPHAGAANTIWGNQFRSILDRLAATRGESWDITIYHRCASCHDPLNEHPVNGYRSQGAQWVRVEAMDVRGIGCESCHGPAGSWLGKHYERAARPEPLAALGKNDLQNLLVRGRVCASCHVGSAEHDLNHEMIAAGHPPLFFELASYHAQLPKHWPASDERMATRDFQAQLWAAGQRATADAALRLLHSRAERADRGGEPVMLGNPRQPWPEFAEISCFSCHQRLRPVDTNVTRVPHWGNWNHAFVAQFDGLLSLRTLQRVDDQAPLAALISLMNGSISSEAGAIRSLSRTAIERDAYLWSPSSSSISRLRQFRNRDLLEIVRRTGSDTPTWEACAQRYLALRAAELAYRDEVRKAAASGAVRSDPSSDLPPADSSGRQQLDSILARLRFAENLDLPEVLRPESNGAPSELRDLAQVAAELGALADAWHQRQLRFDANRYD